MLAVATMTTTQIAFIYRVRHLLASKSSYGNVFV
jgi:hypothetical protein